MSAAPDLTPPASSRVAQWLLVLGFALGILAPGVQLAFDPVAETEKAAIRKENRTPAKLPSWPQSAAEREELPGKFEKWFDDHFAHRSALIRWHNALKLLVFGVEPNSRVLLGREGWIFVNVEPSLDDFRGLNPFTEAELDEWQAALEERAAWVERSGARYLFTVGPSKHSIYPELMNPEFTVVGSERRIDQLFERLRDASSIRALDLRPALLAAKDHSVLYYPHGTHWNELGGFVAYTTIMRELATWDASLKPQSLDSFRLKPTTGLTDSWSPKLHLEDYLQHDYTVLKRKRAPWPAPVEVPGLPRTIERFDLQMGPKPPAPRALLIRDSFGDNIRKLIAAHFSRFYTAANGRTSSQDIGRLLAEERLDYVVDEIVERALMSPVRNTLSARPTQR